MMPFQEAGPEIIVLVGICTLINPKEVLASIVILPAKVVEAAVAEVIRKLDKLIVGLVTEVGILIAVLTLLVKRASD